MQGAQVGPIFEEKQRRLFNFKEIAQLKGVDKCETALGSAPLERSSPAACRSSASTAARSGDIFFHNHSRSPGFGVEEPEREAASDGRRCRANETRDPIQPALMNDLPLRKAVDAGDSQTRGDRFFSSVASPGKLQKELTEITGTVSILVQILAIRDVDLVVEENDRVLTPFIRVSCVEAVSITVGARHYADKKGRIGFALTFRVRGYEIGNQADRGS